MYRSLSVVDITPQPAVSTRGHSRQLSAISYGSVAFDKEPGAQAVLSTAYCEALSAHVRMAGLVLVILGLVLWNLYLVGRLAAVESNVMAVPTTSSSGEPAL